MYIYTHMYIYDIHAYAFTYLFILAIIDIIFTFFKRNYFNSVQLKPQNME